MKKLNLGSGPYPMKGYKNLDRKNGDEVYPLDYPDASVMEIRASHILEHFSHREVQDVLNDWVRVLKPGGTIKIAVPDFQRIAQAVTNGVDVNALGYIMGGHVDDDDRHGCIFDAAFLSELMFNAGLEEVRYWQGKGDTSALGISLNLQGRKPSVPKGTIDFKGVYGIIPTPRYGPSEHHRCIYDALRQFNIQIRSIGGCFWNQHWCRAAEETVNDPDCKYLLSFDYDSVFSPSDVAELYRIMETHPHIDALVPMQSGRGDDMETPLFTMADGAGRTLSQVPITTFEKLTTPIRTGHFGLTLIRADALKTMTHPWMMGTPDTDGRWNDGRVDPDIYFWNKWHAEGKTAHLACRVVIGHIQDMVLWPGDDLTRRYQTMSDYLKHGKPAEAR